MTYLTGGNTSPLQTDQVDRRRMKSGQTGDARQIRQSRRTTPDQRDQKAQAGRAAKNLIGSPVKAATAEIAWMAVMTAPRRGTAIIWPI